MAALSLWRSLALCVAWAATWLWGGRLLHRRDASVRRLRRSQAFSALAALGGLALLGRARRLPDDALGGAGWEHQAFFAMAVGYRLASWWEGRELLRHIMPAFGYSAFLLSQRLAGVGACGLLTELPALLLSHRKLALCATPSARWLGEPASVARFWHRVQVVSLVTQGGPLLAYAASLAWCREPLAGLSFPEAALYHGTAVWVAAKAHCGFASAEACRRSDAGLASCGGDGGGAEENMDSQDGCAKSPTDPEAAPLREVLADELAANSGASGAPLWFAIDGMVYDITAFAATVDCPCDKAALGRWGGRDASHAFHAAELPLPPRALLPGCMVGPLRRRAAEYRIFEHADDEHWMLGVLAPLGVALGAQVLAIGWLVLSCSVPGDAGAVAHADEALRPGDALLLASFTAAGVGVLAFVVQATCGTRLPALSRGPHAFALGCLACQWGLFQGVGGLLSAWPADAASALDVAAALILAAEAAAERGDADDFDASAGYGAAGLALLGGWAARAGGLGRALWQAGQWSGAPAVAMAGGILVMVRHADGQANGRLAPTAAHRSGQAGWAKEASAAARAVAHAAPGLPLLLPYGLLGIAAAAALRPRAAASLAIGVGVGDVSGAGPALASAPALAAPAAAAAAVAAAAAAPAAAARAARCASPALAARAAALALAAAAAASGGRWWWLVALGFLCHLGALAGRNRQRLRRAAEVGRFADLPRHVVGAQALWDRVRTAAAAAVWRCTTLLARAVLELGLPRELRLFACDAPFPRLGGSEDGTYLGVAARYAPRAGGGCGKLPSYFVCNVGQIANGEVFDLQHTMNTLVDVWREFQDEQTKGFMSNLVAVFPDVEDQKVAKEINLSAWESPQDAHRWYVQSLGHQIALHQHSSGILQTFGNMLASLDVAGEASHMCRCTRCGRPAEEIGKMAPARCPVCGGGTIQRPAL